MASVPEQDGCLIVCGENPRLPELARGCGRRVLTYGFGAENDVVCVPLSDDAAGNSFEVVLPDESRHRVFENVHPSPLSAHRGFFGSRPFSQAEQALDGWKWPEL